MMMMKKKKKKKKGKYIGVKLEKQMKKKSLQPKEMCNRGTKWGKWT